MCLSLIYTPIFCANVNVTLETKILDKFEITNKNIIVKVKKINISSLVKSERKIKFKSYILFGFVSKITNGPNENIVSICNNALIKINT